MRLFIAIVPSSEAVRVLLDARERVRRAVRSGRFVRDDQLHITLKFLGDVEPGRIPAIREGMAEAALSASPLQLGVGGLGRFQRGEACVAFCKVLGDTQGLARLHEALETALFLRGFPKEEKKFNPHYTLGRDVIGFANAGADEAMYTAESMILFHSDLSHGVPKYTELYEQNLSKPQ